MNDGIRGVLRDFELADAEIERLTVENERLKAEIERLRPKPLNCFEVCDLFNANKFKGRTDWRLFSEGDSEFHVGTESGHGGYFDHEVADAIAQMLLRDTQIATLEPATGGEVGCSVD